MFYGRVKKLQRGDVKGPATHMRQTLTLGQIGFAPQQSFFRALLLRHVDNCANKLNDLSSIVQYGMANRMEVFHAPIRKQGPEIRDVVYLFPERLSVPVEYMLAVLRVG